MYIYKKPFVVAEIGCNHRGDFDTAIKMIKLAKDCGVDCVKFQKRNVKEMLTVEQYNSPHPVPNNSYGKTYGEHREYLELTFEEHKQLKKYCNKLEIEYFSSVFDLTSARQIISLKPKHMKIASAMTTHFEMLEYIFKNFNGTIHVSAGMSTSDEIDELLNLAKTHNRNKDIVLYHCISSYPLEYKDCCLLNIELLKKMYGDIVKDIGYSGHHKGSSIDIAAYALGANYIERHFTLNQSWKGTDHIASLEPPEMKILVENLNDTYESLLYKSKEIIEVEYPNLEKMKYRKDKWE
jgi:sialic acid synthase